MEDRRVRPRIGKKSLRDYHVQKAVQMMIDRMVKQLRWEQSQEKEKTDE